MDCFFPEIRLVRRHYDLRDENLKCEAVFLSTVTPFASVPLLLLGQMVQGKNNIGKLFYDEFWALNAKKT